MRDSILIKGYREEKENYVKILKLAQKQRKMLIKGRMDEVIDILNDKKEILRDIERIEEVIENEKKGYVDSYDKCGDTANLIREISRVVEEILSVERENEIIFSTGCRAGGSGIDDNAAVPAELVMASYGAKAGGGEI